MHREVIHPEFPFTEAEYAAAWILLGTPADEAIRDATQAKAEFAADLTDRGDLEGGSGWFSFGPRIEFVGTFGAAIHLAADIASGGLLSAPARAAWLEQWTVRLSQDETERILEELDRLGVMWTAHRQDFRNLLTRGTL